MKKYLFGLIAIAFAVAFSAFTAPRHKTTSGTFYFKGTSESTVGQKANWDITEVDPCEAEDGIVCEFLVQNSSYDEIAEFEAFLDLHPSISLPDLITAVNGVVVREKE